MTIGHKVEFKNMRTILAYIENRKARSSSLFKNESVVVNRRMSSRMREERREKEKQVWRLGKWNMLPAADYLSMKSN